jgi:hypothetical protein
MAMFDDEETEDFEVLLEIKTLLEETRDEVLWRGLDVDFKQAARMIQTIGLIAWLKAVFHMVSCFHFILIQCHISLTYMYAVHIYV